MTQTLFAPLLTMTALSREFLFEAMDAIAHSPAIGFQFCFPRPAASDTSSETGKSRILADNQARQHVLQLRQLDLNLALARLRALRKNIEDQLRTIDYFQVRGVGNRSHLCRLQLPVENQCVSADLHGANKQFVQLSF